MELGKGQLYHVYNQGNNRQRLFFERDNYLFFLGKVKNHIAHYADILAWCLMPNHFHFMVYVNAVELPFASRGATPSRAPTCNAQFTQPSQGIPLQSIRSATESRTPIPSTTKLQTIQQSIGIMLASYTRAINTQNNTTGSLFRQKTKSIPLTNNYKLTRAWFISEGITQIDTTPPENQYPNVCFNYIMLNPIKDGIVKRNEDWEFSSYPDFIGIRDGTLINRERITEFGLTLL